MKRTDKPRSIAIQLRALKVSYTGLEHSYVQETLERLAEEVDELAKGREKVCVVHWGNNIKVFETQEESEGLMHKLWLNHEDGIATNNMFPIQKGSDGDDNPDDTVD